MNPATLRAFKDARTWAAHSQPHRMYKIARNKTAVFDARFYVGFERSSVAPMALGDGLKIAAKKARDRWRAHCGIGRVLDASAFAEQTQRTVCSLASHDVGSVWGAPLDSGVRDLQ